MRIASNKIKDVVRFFRDELNGLYDDSEIELFIEFCFEEFLKIKRFNIFEKGNETISESELLKFNFAVKDLKIFKPIQHIIGKADFYGLKFIVNKNVLIPRPETEELVHLIIQDTLKDNVLSILDIGTGSGCIAITLKKKLPQAIVSAIDISDDALLIAKQNAQLNEVEINFINQDILSIELIKNNFICLLDIIVSNPPYVRDLEKNEMHNNVLNYEPHLALFVSDNDPLIYYKAIVDFALKNLKKNGKLYLEINEQLGFETKKIVEDAGLKHVELIKDINGKNRILRGII